MTPVVDEELKVGENGVLGEQNPQENPTPMKLKNFFNKIVECVYKSRVYAFIKKIWRSIVLIAAVPFVLWALNRIWYVFETKRLLDIDSPLGYGEGLQMFVDVSIAIIIAYLTWKIERGWRASDRKMVEFEDEIQAAESISNRIKMLNSFFGAKVTGYPSPEFYKGSTDVLLVLKIFGGDGAGLFPTYFCIKDLKTTYCAINDHQICIDAVEIRFENGDFYVLFYNQQPENRTMKADLLAFLHDVMYLRIKERPSNIRVGFSAAVTDLSFCGPTEGQPDFQCKWLFELVPVTAFLNDKTFSCEVHCNRVERVA